jgi:hypothetical protein
VKSQEDFAAATLAQVWHVRKDPRRSYLKYSMRVIAHVFAERIQAELDIPVACYLLGQQGHPRLRVDRKDPG